MASRLLFYALLSCILLFTGCGGKGRDPGEFRVGLEAMPQNLDPRYAADAHSVRIVPLLFNGILKKTPEGGLAPDLAESLETPSPTVYVAKLKRGVRFSNGAELTSADVAATYLSAMDPANGSPMAGALEPLEAVETPDSRTIIFRLKRIYVSFPFSLTLGILPREDAKVKDLGENLTGTGPFKLSGVKSGEEVRLTPNTFSFEGKPKLEKVVFRVLPNATTRMLEIRTGGIDLLQNAVPPYSVKFLEREAGLKVIREPGSSYQYLGFNHEDRILKNPKVRRALAHAVDRDAIISTVLSGQARPATMLFPPEHRAHAPGVAAPALNRKLSEALLDEAGYPDPDGPGPLPRFTLSYKTSTDKTGLEVAALLADQFKKVGVDVEVRGFEWGTFFNDVKKGNFQLMSLRWVGLTDPDSLHYLFHSDSLPPKGANRGRYKSAEVDRLIDSSRGEAREAERLALYRKIQETLAADDAYVSLWWLDNVVVVRDEFSGFKVLPGGEYTSLAAVAHRPFN